MGARLGFAVYVLAWIVAIPIVVLVMAGYDDSLTFEQTISLAMAGIILLTGRGIYYVLSGH